MWNLSVTDGQIMRAADCKPFVGKTRRVFRQSRGAEGQIGLQPRVVRLAIYAAFHTFASSMVLGTTMVPSLMAATAALYFSITSAGI